MIKMIISWTLVMGVVILGKFTPIDGQITGVVHFLTGFVAGTIGIILGAWE